MPWLLALVARLTRSKDLAQPGRERHAAGMVWLIGFCLVALAVIAGVLYFLSRAKQEGAEHEAERAHYQSVADEVGGLTLSSTGAGRPRLRGNVAGIDVEIDSDNHFDRGFGARLGLRASVPFAGSVPEGMVAAGQMPELLVERFGGEARPLGVGDASLLALYVRGDREARGWWHHPELAGALLELPGVAMILLEGQLTILFDDLDATNVRAALRIPPLLRDAVERPTVH